MFAGEGSLCFGSESEVSDTTRGRKERGGHPPYDGPPQTCPYLLKARLARDQHLRSRCLNGIGETMHFIDPENLRFIIIPFPLYLKMSNR